jgi:outer membrane receptor protein involved in Fe transport
MGCPIPASAFQPTPVYMEDSNNAFSTASLRFEWSASRMALSAGSAVWLQRPHYQIDQPIGAFSPYSAAPVRTDSTSFASDFSTGETGSFAQFTMHPIKALELSAGGRLQTFAFGSHTTLTPRASVRYSLGESVSLHAAYASYAQLPPYVYMMSYPQNRSMSPMRSTHEIVGMDLGFIPSSAIRIEAYNKQYSDTPASTEYPSVTLHDMVDMLGQQFVWLPMNSGGDGTSSGIEVSDLTRIHSSLTVRGSLAYSRAKFAGLDHVMRPSNFDFPWIFNVAALERLGRNYGISARYGYASGRPYTPYDLADSTAQDRPIYDVSQMNTPRAPYFARLDAQLNKDVVVRGLHLEIYAGVNNILDRKNFLSYVWLPRYKKDCETVLNPVDEIDQMPIFPNFGLRYIFR